MLELRASMPGKGCVIERGRDKASAEARNWCMSSPLLAKCSQPQRFAGWLAPTRDGQFKILGQHATVLLRPCTHRYHLPSWVRDWTLHRDWTLQVFRSARNSVATSQHALRPFLKLGAIVKAMIDKKRGVKANCANVQKAREVTAQRRAAEAAGSSKLASRRWHSSFTAYSKSSAADRPATKQTAGGEAAFGLFAGYQQQPPPPRPFSMLSRKVGKPTSRASYCDPRNPTQLAPSSPSCLPPPPLHGGAATDEFGSHRPPQDIAFPPARSIAQAVSVSLASSSAAMVVGEDVSPRMSL
ncbi:hypothetical protein HaLaN_10806 [Haematococcus lacustris]|uniref:Uncharacterized protein n=1 Tax=Haematococcus lacustris TaxID=44745 RepID=A0A699Z6G0_HAELA|nr:hypothetical protein HaLaN_10806 [Haematococcus lacustris]